MSASELERLAAAYRQARRPVGARRRAIRNAVAEGAAGQDREVRWRRRATVGLVLAAALVAAVVLSRLLQPSGALALEDNDPSVAPYGATKRSEPVSAVSGSPEGTVATPKARAPVSEDAGGGSAEARVDITLPPRGEALVDASHTSGAAMEPEAPRSHPPRRRAVTERKEKALGADEVEGMRLLREAERKLDRNPAVSLRLLRTHAKRFRDSPLAQEREALSVLALCRLGRVADGVRRRNAFLTAHSASAYAARVRRACAEQ